MVSNIVRGKHIFVEDNEIAILLSNYIFGLTFESKSEYIVRKYYFNFIIFHKNLLASRYYIITDHSCKLMKMF